MTRTSSRVFGVKTRCVQTDASWSRSRVGSSRWKCRLFVTAADVTMPSRPGMSGPLASRLAEFHPSRRAIAGGIVVFVRESSPAGAAKSSTDRVQAAAGRIGTSVTTGPGELTPTGSAPVAMSIRSHPRTPGSTNGVPLASGSEISTSPIRNIVCVHELP
jgi:hypothetical protein